MVQLKIQYEPTQRYLLIDSSKPSLKATVPKGLLANMCMLLGQQAGYTKLSCFLCPRDNGHRKMAGTRIVVRHNNGL